MCIVAVECLLPGCTTGTHPLPAMYFLLRPAVEFFGYLHSKHVTFTTTFLAATDLTALAPEYPLTKLNFLNISDKIHYFSCQTMDLKLFNLVRMPNWQCSTTRLEQISKTNCIFFFIDMTCKLLCVRFLEDNLSDSKYVGALYRSISRSRSHVRCSWNQANKRHIT